MRHVHFSISNANLDYIDKLIALAERITRTNKRQWEARKDVTKTPISLSSAILVFTITFFSLTTQARDVENLALCHSAVLDTLCMFPRMFSRVALDGDWSN